MSAHIARAPVQHLPDGLPYPLNNGGRLPLRETITLPERFPMGSP